MLRRRFNGAKHVTEAWAVIDWVGERSIRGEAIAKAVVDFMEVRMPE